MNVFYLHRDPNICAQMHCDKHVVKMCIEYAQLMSTAHRVIDGDLWYGRTTNVRKIARYFHPDSIMNQSMYKVSLINHPSNVWLRENAENYTWLYDMWTALCGEYKYRYGKTHESFRKLEYYLVIPPMKISLERFTEPTPAMGAFPQCIVEDDSMTSYRNYYWEAKYDISKWTKRDKPEWWNERERIKAETSCDL